MKLLKSCLSPRSKFITALSEKNEASKANSFLFLGRELEKLKQTQAGTRLSEALPLAIDPGLWVASFLENTEDVDMPQSRKVIESLFELLKGFKEAAQNASITKDVEKTIHKATIWILRRQVEAFDKAFERDSEDIFAFALTPKRDLSTKTLIEDAAKKFPAELRVIMPAKVIEDVQEAGRCLVFDRPTACAFHICRATEGLMRAYYKKLTGIVWPPPGVRHDWKVLADQLRVNGAPKEITQRLQEIREDRNAFRSS